jgi:hypothetical protein
MGFTFSGKVELVMFVKIDVGQKLPAGHSCAGKGAPESWHVYPGLHLMGVSI